MKNKAIDYIQIGDENLPIFLSAVFGSHNYNLNTENSDVDMRYFFCPTFHQIYTKKEITKSSTSTEVDYVAHDLRKLPGFLNKSNPNVLELLFSVDLKGNQNIIKYLMKHREEIARHNLTALYHCIKGTIANKAKNLLKGTESTRVNVDLYGYDSKELHHIVRMVDFAFCYFKNGFTSFEKALRYEEGNTFRETLLNIKHYKIDLTKEEAADTASFVINKFDKNIAMQKAYTSAPMNKEVIDEFSSLVENEIYAQIIRSR